MLSRSQRLRTLSLVVLVVAVLSVTPTRAQNVPEEGMVAAGSGHTVGLKADGTVLATGDNYDGQCAVGDWTNIVQVAAANHHTVGLKTDGTVLATGDNYNRECDVLGWTNIIQVATGIYHTVGLKTDGTVLAAGDNAYGQCAVSDWTDIVQVAAGNHHTVGLKTDGTVVAVGSTTEAVSAAATWTNITQVAAGAYHTVGLKTDGTVVAAGDNFYGQCAVSAWIDIVQVAAYSFRTLGLKADGTVLAAGNNANGECDVLGWKNIVQMAAGARHTVGLKADGTVLAAGNNANGECSVGAWNLKPNSPPTFQPIGNQQITEGQLLEFTVLAVDPERDVITYEAAGLPTGAVFDPVSRLFSWRPDFAQAGSYSIIFSATDNGTPSMKGQLPVVVTVGNAPTLPEQIRALVLTVLSLGLEKDVENSYLANLKKVEAFVAANKIIPALNQLNATIHKAQQDIGQRKIEARQGQGLVGMTNELIRALTVP